MANKFTELNGIARRLVVDGLLEESRARQAYRESEETHTPFIEYVVTQGILSATDIAYAASQDFGLSLLDINQFDFDLIPSEMISEKLVNKHHALPLYQRGDRLYIGVSDPTNLAALNEFKFHTGINTHAVLIEEDKLKKAIEIVLSERANAAFKSIDDEDLDTLDITMGEDSAETVTEKDAADDAPIVRFIHKIILDGINNSVSDIHFEPYEKKYRIRYRRDGILYETASPPISLAARITARLKVMSRLDISERRVPQDGHFKMVLSKNRSVDFRVSTLPTVSGEKVVVRILDPMSSKIGIDALGFNVEQKQKFLAAIHQPQGMVLVTGPTGSGKTITLYTALNILNVKENNISTVEDPVEINLEGINQVNVNNKAGLTFANALRAFLRQDPDIVMLGEIRDLETSEIAIKAAQTGHMVLSTLHTNSAPETLTRLSSMGVPRYNIGSTVTLVIAQRLARRLCKKCRLVASNLPLSILKEEGFNISQVENVTIYTANSQGCEHCKNGYTGRIGLYEMLSVTPEVEQVILNGGNSRELLDVALKQGMSTLRMSGLSRVVDGTTSLEEINRVTVD